MSYAHLKTGEKKKRNRIKTVLSHGPPPPSNNCPCTDYQNDKSNISKRNASAKMLRLGSSAYGDPWRKRQRIWKGKKVCQFDNS